MGSYVQDDLDEYEDDFIDDQDGDVGPSRYASKYTHRYADEDGEEEEEEDDEEEEEEPVSEEALKLLKYRQKLKEQFRSQLRRENGGSGSKTQEQVRRPALSNFGSFFGPSQPVIAERVAQESKALLESRHLAPKASTSQNNAKKVNMPSRDGPKNGVSRQPSAKQVITKAQTIKHTRDYSFLLSEDADVPKPSRDSGQQQKKLVSRPDARPTQVPAQSIRPSGHSGRRVVNGYEQRKPHGTPQVCSTRTAPVRKLTSDSRASAGSSDLRRQMDVRKQPQPTKQLGTGTGSSVVRPAMSKTLPTKKPPSSIHRNTTEKKTSGAPAGYVTKHSVPNGQRLPVDKSRAPGVMRSRERDTNGQYSRDNRILRKENGAASRPQMKPPKQMPIRAEVGRDPSRTQKPHGQMNVRSQSGGVRKDPINRKRRAEEVDDDVGDYRSIIRGLFGYNKDRYQDDDDDDDCMEAGFDTILQEESRSARIARKEDEEELAKIQEEERQERLRKKAKMRKMAQR